MSSLFSNTKKCVSFVYLKEGSDYYPIGTGFFIAYKFEDGRDMFHNYFVTAKHVLINEKGDFLPQVYLRLNKTDGTSEYVTLDLTQYPILSDDDQNVDIAIVKGAPSAKDFDFSSLAQEMLSTEKIIQEFHIKEGDEVFFSGLFTSHVGQKKIQPILRFGRLALLPEEKIEWKENGKPIQFIDLYLMECQSFAGNSGSPVFFYLNPRLRDNAFNVNPVRIFLAGIMKGSFNTGSEVESTNTKRKFYSYQNVGIAAVVPCHKLVEILISKEAVDQRMESEKSTS